jgi:hypothetical protein
MNCPHSFANEFNEFNNVCQECRHFQECLGKYYGLTEKEIENNNLGDNYPTYQMIHIRLKLNKERSRMVEKLLKEQLGCITKEEIEDWNIDVELYNKQCRKEKIKRQYKKKETAE